MDRCVRLLIATSIAALAAAAPPAHPARAAGPALRGIVDSFGYGYAVTVAVNGVPLPTLRGDGQQAVRLFGADHPLRAQSTPETAGLFVLREGENTIRVEFTRRGEAANALRVKVEVPDRYDRPLFQLTSATRPAGLLERTFVIAPSMPPDFRTLEVTDADLGAPPGR